MNRRTNERIARWLAAETAGDEERAEAALAAAIGALPRFAPSPGFADSVMSAVAPATTPRWAWVPRVAAVIALALVGTAAGLLPALGALPVRAPSLAAIAQTAVGATAWVGGWISAGFDVWDALAGFGRALGVAASTPQVASGLAATVAVASVALYTLHRLLTPERRTWS